MLYEALTLLTTQLNSFIPPMNGQPVVTVGNIAFAESGDQAEAIQNRVVVSLVNLEEEATLKNGRLTRAQNAANGVTYHNPPVNLNLYLLFSANYTDYANALRRLSTVVLFFQGKHTFTFQNSPSGIAEELPLDFKLILNLHSLSFEQVNHLWGSLGGKQVPSVLYKARLVSIEAEPPKGTGPIIEHIKASEVKV